MILPRCRKGSVLGVAHMTFRAFLVTAESLSDLSIVALHRITRPSIPFNPYTHTHVSVPSTGDLPYSVLSVRTIISARGLLFTRRNIRGGFDEASKVKTLPRGPPCV